MFLIINLIAQLNANLIFNQALGTSTIFISAKNKTSFVGVSFIITIFTTLGSILTYVIDQVIGLELNDLRLFVYVLIIGLLYIASLSILYFIKKDWQKRFSKYIHISAFNCAVIGSLYMINDGTNITTLGEYISYGIYTGFGFVLASLFLAAAYKKLNSSKVPTSFRGMPAMLVYIGMISMAIWSLK